MENKKIGIITFHNAHNYGAMLQVYALQEVLAKYDTKVINFKNPGIEKAYKPFRINTKNPITLVRSLIASTFYYKRNKLRYKNFNDFMNEKLKLTREYKTESELKENAPNCDIYITGSDQVWNYEISHGNIDAYTLNFGPDFVKKISYAASIGTNELNPKHKEEYINNINKIDCISAREETAKTYLEKLLNRNIETTLDPTLLLEKERWEELCNESEQKQEKEKYILAYVLTDDPEYYKIVNYLSQKTGLKVIHFKRKDMGIDNILRNANTDGPIEFLNLIKNAEYVIATSFHATVFSIIFNKKFWIIPPKKIGSRITNLLKMLNIDERAVSSLKDFKDVNYDKDINYEDVEKILEAKKEESIKFLEKSINEETL